jgi:hypothetical protein
MRRHAAAVFVLGTAIAGAILLAGRPGPASQLPMPRNRIVDDATRLLGGVPAGSGDTGPAPRALPTRSAFDVGDREPDRPTPAAALLSVQEAASRGARTNLESLVRLSAEEEAALSSSPVAEPRERPVPPAGEAPAASGTAIPDSIEGVRTGSPHGDALAAYTISAGLRTLESAHSPLLLASIRGGPEPLRAHFNERDALGAWQEVPGWFEVGESPVGGWRLLAISVREVTLITPVGNLLRLRLPGESSVAGAKVVDAGGARRSNH